MKIRPGETTHKSFEQFVAAVGEGFCPDHELALRDDGYCSGCQAWWWWDRLDDTVVEHYYSAGCRRGQCGREHRRLPLHADAEGWQAVTEISRGLP